MKRKINVLITGTDRDGIDQIGQAIVQSETLAPSVRLLANLNRDPLDQLPTPPDVLLLAVGQNWSEELDQIVNFNVALRTQVVLVVFQETAALLRKAMYTGVRDVFSFPLNSADLISTAMRLGQQQIQAEQADRTSHNTSQKSGKITAMINANGGSGASLIACNVAHVMALKMKQRVALLDMDLQFGSQSSHLNLQPVESVIDALQKVTDLDDKALEGYMTKHESGLHLLSSNFEFMPQPWTVSVPDLRKMIDLLRSQYTQVIVDLPRVIDPFTNTFIEEIDNLVLVVEQRITHLRSAKRLLKIITQDLAVPSDRLHIVINRFDKRTPLAFEDIQVMLDVPSISVIPNDYDRVLNAVNLGRPLLQSAKGAPITQAMTDLAQKFADMEEIQKKGFLKSALTSFLT